MYFGTSRSDEAPTTLDDFNAVDNLDAVDDFEAETIAGRLTCAGTIRAGRCAVVLGADGVQGAECVAIDGERLGVVEVMESVGSWDVGTDAGSGEDRVTPVLAEPPALTPAPVHPATTIERTAAPTRERAAYELACLTRTHASEGTDVERSISDMMAW